MIISEYRAEVRPVSDMFVIQQAWAHFQAVVNRYRSQLLKLDVESFFDLIELREDTFVSFQQEKEFWTVIGWLFLQLKQGTISIAVGVRASLPKFLDLEGTVYKRQSGKVSQQDLIDRR